MRTVYTCLISQACFIPVGIGYKNTTLKIVPIASVIGGLRSGGVKVKLFVTQLGIVSNN